MTLVLLLYVIRRWPSLFQMSTLTILPVQLVPASLTTSSLLTQYPTALITAGLSEPDLPYLPPSPLFAPFHRPLCPELTQSQIEEALHYRASLLFNLKDDPRFLRFLPVVFPPPPSFDYGLQAEDSAMELAFCTWRLVTLYPGYSERGELACSVILTFPHVLTFSTATDVWYHLRFDMGGILPFVAYITGDNYDPRDLSRRLSSDLLDVSFFMIIHVHSCAHHTHRRAATRDTIARLLSTHLFTASPSTMISSPAMSLVVPTTTKGTPFPDRRTRQMIRRLRMEIHWPGRCPNGLVASRTMWRLGRPIPSRYVFRCESFSWFLF